MLSHISLLFVEVKKAFEFGNSISGYPLKCIPKRYPLNLKS